MLRSLFGLLPEQKTSERTESHQTRPNLEALEDRIVPSTLDLTTPGSSGVINDAIFSQSDTQPTGTGLIDSFLRLQGNPNQSGGVEQGYNTDARPLQFDELNSANFTRSLPLSEIPLVQINGTFYRVFLLDINQKSSQPFLSLDQLRFYLSGSPTLNGYDAGSQTLGNLAPVYDMNPGGGTDNWVKLDYSLNHGSGSGDMLLYVPESVFSTPGAPSGPQFVTLYSQFGVHFAGNSGFEEWAAGPGVVATGGISGTAFLVSQDGTTTTVLPDVLVFLDLNKNGILDSDEPFTNTDANGNYSFHSLAIGNLGTDYLVTAQTPDGTIPFNNAPTTIDVLLTLQNTQVDNVNFFFTIKTKPQ
jgi:hypothetical protein